MPDAGREGAEVLRGGDPGSWAQDAPTHEREDPGAELSRALEDRVFDPDPEVRSLAVSLIPGLEEPSPDLLASALEDRCPDVVIAAAEALVVMRSPRGADRLARCLTHRPELVGPIALALSDLEVPELEDLLLECIAEAEPPTRIALIRALASSGTPRSLTELLRAIDCGDPHVEREALLALTRLHARAPNLVSAEGLPRDRIEEKLVRLTTSADERDQATAIELISWLRFSQGAAFLLELADVSTGGVRERALEGLGVVSAGAEGESLRLIAEMADRSPAVAALALDRLAAARDEEARGLCLGLTRHADARVRERSAALAGRSGGRNAANALLLLTGDPVGHVRAQAAEALGLMRWTDAGPCLESLLHDPYPSASTRWIRTGSSSTRAGADRGRPRSGRVTRDARRPPLIARYRIPTRA
jgi:HEAT repeat protein